MRFFVRHWYSLGLIPAAVALCFLLFGWNHYSVLERIYIWSFIGILLHQFEEYGFPGGEPMIMNKALMGSDQPQNYPLNQFSAMLVNCIFTYVIYVLPMFLPNVMWLGIGPILMGFGQLIVHGIWTPIKMHRWYDPGLLDVWLIQVPLAVYYIWYVNTNHLATGWDWFWGIVYCILASAFLLGFMTYAVLSNRKSKWVFAPEELQRFDVLAKLEAKGIDVHQESSKLQRIDHLKGYDRRDSAHHTD